MLSKNWFCNLLKYLICACAILSAFVLISIILFLVIGGVSNFNIEFIQTLLPSIFNTLLLLLVALLISVPLGIACAIQIQFYAKRSKLNQVISFSIDCLAGIPSIIYGLFGLAFFVYFIGFSKSIVAGALTVAILVLPLIIKNTQQAIKMIPSDYIEASYALGATKFETVKRIVIPNSLEGIITGLILSIGKIIGETAAILFVAGTVDRFALSIFSPGVTLSNKLYLILQEPTYSQYGISEAYAIAVLLIIIVVILNISIKITKMKLKKTMS